MLVTEIEDSTGRLAKWSEHAKLFLERFWSNVSKTDLCWEWIGGRNSDGYGVTSVDGQMCRAARVAYMLLHGPIPDDLFICHHCDNPACVRPDHLFAGTHTDNMRDMIAKGRDMEGKKRRARGVHNGNARLTNEMVAQIRLMHATGEYSTRDIGKVYGILSGHVSKIVNGQLWRTTESGWLL